MHTIYTQVHAKQGDNMESDNIYIVQFGIVKCRSYPRKLDWTVRGIIALLSHRSAQGRLSAPMHMMADRNSA